VSLHWRTWSAASAWRIELSETAEKQLARLGTTEARWIVAFLRERIDRNDPRGLGKPLVGKAFRGLWRYRVGDYRLICDLQDDRLVLLVVSIGHRRDVYRG
jgi:mRNA interferase RelE/StbE